MAKEKEVKTNAMRILDKHKISYGVNTYECDEFIDGLHTAEKTGAPVEQSFSGKTTGAFEVFGGFCKIFWLSVYYCNPFSIPAFHARCQDLRHG